MENKSGDSKITDIPDHKFVAFTQFNLLNNLSFKADLECNSASWVSDTEKLDAYEVANLLLSYRFDKPKIPWQINVGVNNVGDSNYLLDSGFPNPGRMWFANAKWTF